MGFWYVFQALKDPEGPPAPAREDHCLGIHCSGPLGEGWGALSSCACAVCQGLLGILAWGPEPTSPHLPSASSFSLSLPLSGALGGFILSCAVVIYPLTRMSHGTGFYLFQEKIAEGTYALWYWEPAPGPEPGKGLRTFLGEISPATKAEAAPGLTTGMGTKEEGWAWIRPVILPKQQSLGPFFLTPLPRHHILLWGTGQHRALTYPAKSARSPSPIAPS